MDDGGPCRKAKNEIIEIIVQSLNAEVIDRETLAEKIGCNKFALDRYLTRDGWFTKNELKRLKLYLPEITDDQIELSLDSENLIHSYNERHKNDPCNRDCDAKNQLQKGSTSIINVYGDYTNINNTTNQIGSTEENDAARLSKIIDDVISTIIAGVIMLLFTPGVDWLIALIIDWLKNQ